MTARPTSEAEIQFDWVLEGRAIPDVWISPLLDDRDSAKPPGRSLFGSTQRIYDPTADSWWIIWSNRSTGDVETMIGRRVGEDIVQLGVGADGAGVRWSFTEIKADSFRWLGEREVRRGDWRLRGEFRGQRAA